jgi:hypothetical protein
MPAKTGAQQPFSDELDAWLERDGEKTIGALEEVFDERTFAVTILLLMAPTALPVPTGGITHVFELATVLLAAEMVAGRRTVWLPESWRKRPLGRGITEKAIPALIRLVRRCERWSRPRANRVIEHAVGWRLLGLLIAALTVSAALAPPFSGLDTLPGLGVVLIALAILLRDLVVAAIGLVIGLAGTALSIAVGTAIARAVRDLF